MVGKKESISFLSRIQTRDVVAFIVLIACFTLLGLGVDTYVTGLTSLIVGYYFSKRVYEEKNA